MKHGLRHADIVGIRLKLRPLGKSVDLENDDSPQDRQENGEVVRA